MYMCLNLGLHLATATAPVIEANSDPGLDDAYSGQIVNKGNDFWKSDYFAIIGNATMRALRDYKTSPPNSFCSGINDERLHFRDGWALLPNYSYSPCASNKYTMRSWGRFCLQLYLCVLLVLSSEVSIAEVVCELIARRIISITPQALRIEPVYKLQASVTLSKLTFSRKRLLVEDAVPCKIIANTSKFSIKSYMIVYRCFNE